MLIKSSNMRFLVCLIHTFATTFARSCSRLEVAEFSSSSDGLHHNECHQNLYDFIIRKRDVDIKMSGDFMVNIDIILCKCSSMSTSTRHLINIDASPYGVCGPPVLRNAEPPGHQLDDGCMDVNTN